MQININSEIQQKKHLSASKQLVKHYFQQSRKEILLNSSKILKGNKKKIRQHLRTQLLKRTINYSASPNKNHNFKYLTKSTLQTLDNTPRINYDTVSNEVEIDQFQAEKQLFQFIHEQRRVQSRKSKQRIKLFNEPINKSTINKIVFSKMKERSKTPYTTLSQNQQINFQDTLISKELKQTPQLETYKYRNEVTQNSQSIDNEDKIKFQSLNFDKRMNEYMNALIKKTHKDEIDLLSYLNKKEQQNINKKNEDLSKYCVHDQLYQSFKSRPKYFMRNAKSQKKSRNLSIQSQKSILSKQIDLNKYNTTNARLKQMILSTSNIIEKKTKTIESK